MLRFGNSAVRFVTPRVSHPVGFDLCGATHPLRDGELDLELGSQEQNMNDGAWRVRKTPLSVAGSSCGESPDRF